MKKILLSLSLIVAVAAVVVGATTAYFSDSETSEGNTFTAGTLDLGIDENHPSQDFSVLLENMAPGVWSDKQKIVLENSGSLPLVVDKFTVTNLEEKDQKTTVDMEERNIEQCWSGGLKELNDKLTVRVRYNGAGDKAIFEAWQPEDYGPTGNNDGMTFAYDVNVDGRADFRVQYMDGVWRYSEVVKDSGNWKWSDWEDVPEEYSYGKDDNGRFWLKLPVDMLGGYDSLYKFGVDSNEKESVCQTFYSTNPESLWSGENNVSSDYYVEMTTKSEKNKNANQVAKKIDVKIFHGDTPIKNTSLYDLKNGFEIQNAYKETINTGGKDGHYQFKFRLSEDADNDYQSDGVEATIKVQASQVK